MKVVPPENLVCFFASLSLSLLSLSVFLLSFCVSVYTHLQFVSSFYFLLCLHSSLYITIYALIVNLLYFLSMLYISLSSFPIFFYKSILFVCYLLFLTLSLFTSFYLSPFFERVCSWSHPSCYWHFSLMDGLTIYTIVYRGIDFVIPTHPFSNKTHSLFWNDP